MKLELLVRPKPYHDESHRGYMWRLAVCNGMQSPIALRKRFGNENLTDTEFYEQLYLSNLDQESHIHLKSQTKRCGSRFIIQSGIRKCEQCWFEKPYLREVWEYALLPFCLKHQVVLTDVSEAEAFLTEHHTTRVETDIHYEVTDSFLTLISYLSGRLGFTSVYHESLFSHLDELTIDQLQEFILLIGSYRYRTSMLKPRKSPIKSNVIVALEIVDSAADILSNWPANLSKIFPFNEFKDNNRRSVKALIGYLNKALREELVGTEFKSIQKDIAKYISQSWPDSIDKKSIWILVLGKGDESTYETGTELSKRIGVCLQTIVNWIERGDLVGNIRTLASGQRQITVLKNQDLKITRLRESLI